MNAIQPAKNQNLAIAHDYTLLRPGDVIWANRIAHGLPYNHCGIYIGDGRVIHFAAPEGSEISPWNAIIHETSFEHFQDGCEVRVIEFPNCRYTPEETIVRARSRLGEHGYDFTTNNCDHFATWCKTGKHQSLQVDIVKDTVRAISRAFENEQVDSIVNLVCDIHDIFEHIHKERVR